jgi:hypothetical protein
LMLMETICGSNVCGLLSWANILSVCRGVRCNQNRGDGEELASTGNAWQQRLGGWAGWSRRVLGPDIRV